MEEQTSGRVLLISDEHGASQRYRCLHAQQQLRLYGKPSSAVRRFCVEPLPGNVGDHELVISHRVTADRQVEELVRQVHDRHGLVIFDIDDLVFDPDSLKWIDALRKQGPILRVLYRKVVRRYHKTMHLSDAILASTDFVARQASLVGKPVWVHRNAFSVEMCAISEKAKQRPRQACDRIVIGYASGTPTHDRDFREVEPALHHILRKYPQTELWVIGYLNLGKGWGTLSDRIKRLPFVPWRQLPNILVQLDINLAPLEVNNPYCQAKSEIKYIEAGLVCVPTVASGTDAFQFAIRSGDSGFLVGTHEDWVEALERLIEDPALRRQMGERAYADVMERYHPVVRGRELITTLNRISEAIAGRPFWPDDPLSPRDPRQSDRIDIQETIRLDPAAEQRPSLTQMILYVFRYRDVLIFLLQVWIYLRHHLARLLPSGKPEKSRERG